MTELRWGILSTANIAKKFINTVRSNQAQNVEAVGSRSLQKAQDWAKENGVPKAYATYDEVIADPRVNAVYIPLPTKYHHEYTLKAAKAGKHVLCEKPFATSLAQAKEMAEVCKQNKVFLMDNTMFVHSLRTDSLKTLISDKKLGEVHRISVKTSFFLDDDTNIRLSKELEPDGCIGDIGWYCARVLLMVFPDDLPIGVFSTIQYRNNDKEKGVPTNCTATFWYDKEKKKVATLDCSFTLARQQYFEVGGSEASVRVENYINARDGGNYLFFDKTMERSTVEVEKCQPEVILLRRFREQVEMGEQAEWEKFRSAPVKNQWLLDALHQSSEANTPVKLEWSS